MQLGAWRLRRCISRRASRQNTGDLYVPILHRLASQEVVGFELKQIQKKLDLFVPASIRRTGVIQECQVCLFWCERNLTVYIRSGMLQS